MKYWLLFLIVMIALSSCNSSKMILEGPHAAKYENQPVMYGVLRKQKLGMTNSYTIDSLQWIGYLKNYSVPELFLFDKKGNYIPYRLKAGASKEANKSIDSLCFGSFKKYESYLMRDSANYKLHDELNKLHSPDGKAVSASMFPDADYTAFIFFYDQMKSTNKKYVYKWEQKLEQQNGPCNISILKINLAPQTWWSGMTSGKPVNVKMEVKK